MHIGTARLLMDHYVTAVFCLAGLVDKQLNPNWQVASGSGSGFEEVPPGIVLMPWSHLCVELPRMSNVRQIQEVCRNCNVLSRSATYYAALTRVSSLPPRRRHDSYRADFTRQKASRKSRKGPVTTTYCHVDAMYLPRVSHVSPQIPELAIRGSYEAALRKGVTTASGKNWILNQI